MSTPPMSSGTIIGSLPTFHISQPAVILTLIVSAFFALCGLVGFIYYLNDRKYRRRLREAKKALAAKKLAEQIAPKVGNNSTENVLFSLRESRESHQSDRPDQKSSGFERAASENSLQPELEDGGMFDPQPLPHRQVESQPPLREASHVVAAAVDSDSVDVSTKSSALPSVPEQQGVDSDKDYIKFDLHEPAKPHPPSLASHQKKSVSTPQLLNTTGKPSPLIPPPTATRARPVMMKPLGGIRSDSPAGPSPARSSPGAPQHRSVSAVSLMVNNQSKVARTMSFPEVSEEEPDTSRSRASKEFRQELGAKLSSPLQLVRQLSLANTQVPQIKRQQLEIVDEIAQGQYGLISRAIFRNNKDCTHYVVVKTLSMTASSSERLQFLEEAERLCVLAHNNILRCLGVVLEQDSNMIVLDYISDGSLSQFLKTSKFPLAKLVRITQEIAAGLHYLAQSNVVHGDIQCRNIMTSRTGGIKISGFARPCPRLRVDNQQMQWRAPETWEEGITSTASDVWSTATCFWEIFRAAQTPFDSFSSITAMMQAVSKGVRLPSLDIPEAIYILMIHCWHPVPACRPSASVIHQYMTTDVEARNSIALCDETCLLEHHYLGTVQPSSHEVKEWIASGARPKWEQLPSLDALREVCASFDTTVGNVSIDVSASQSSSRHSSQSFDFKLNTLPPTSVGSVLQQGSTLHRIPSQRLVQTTSLISTPSDEYFEDPNLSYEPLASRVQKEEQPTYESLTLLRDQLSGARLRTSSNANRARVLSIRSASNNNMEARSTNVDSGTPDAPALPLRRLSSSTTKSASTIVLIGSGLSRLEMQTVLTREGGRNGMYVVSQIEESKWAVAAVRDSRITHHVIRQISESKFFMNHIECPSELQSLAHVLSYYSTVRPQWSTPLVIPLPPSNSPSNRKLVVHNVQF